MNGLTTEAHPKTLTSLPADMRDQKEHLIKKTQENLTNWPLSHTRKDEPFFQVIDFFSGAGGMTLGFESASGQIPFFKSIGGCDINPDAARTYEKNFGAPGIVQDIAELVEDDKLNEFIGKLNYDPTKPLVVIGCAPCQGFTSHRKKSWGQEDTRNDLVSIFATVAAKLNPECIVMENVPEMLSKKYWAYFERAKKIYEDAGYVVHKRIYNAASFGVPQERFRAVVIAMKKEFLMPEPLLESHEFVTVRDAISHLPKVEAGEVFVEDAYHVSARHKESTIEVIKAVPKNGGSRPQGIGPKCLDKVKGYTDVYGRLNWDKPSITITQYARNPASGRYIHPEQDRGLTIREAASLQSFPRGFQFTGTFDAMFKQIGEAVPPRFSCAIAANVLVELLSPEPNELDKVAHNRDITEPVSNSYSSVIAGIKIARKTA